MKEEELKEEHNTMLQELRIAVPGMQMLFAFLLTIPFNQGFGKTTGLQQGVYAGDLVCTALASIFLIGPSMYHRLHWRRDVEDKDRMLHVINHLAIIGGVFLSLAIVASIFLIIDYVFGEPASLATTIAVALTCLCTWYGLPLLRRLREEKHEPRKARPA